MAAARLIKNDKVLTAIRTGQRELGDQLAVSRERVLEGLLVAVEMARIRQDPGAMIRAWAEIGRMYGFYSPERAFKVDVAIAAKRVIEKMETMTEEALLRLAEPEPS